MTRHLNHGAAVDIFSRLPLELRREIYPYTLDADGESIMIEEILKSAPHERELSGDERDDFYTALDFHIHKATASDRKDALSFLLGNNTFMIWPGASHEKLLALTQDLSEAGYPNKIQELLVMIDVNLIPRGSAEFDQFGQAPEAYRALKSLSQLEQIEEFTLILRRKHTDQFDIRNDKLWDIIGEIRNHVLASSRDPDFQVSWHVEHANGGMLPEDIAWMWDSEVESGDDEDDDDDDEEEEEDLSSSGDDDEDEEDISSSGDDVDDEEDHSFSGDEVDDGRSLFWRSLFFWR